MAIPKTNQLVPWGTCDEDIANTGGGECHRPSAVHPATQLMNPVWYAAKPFKNSRKPIMTSNWKNLKGDSIAALYEEVL